MVKLIRKLKKLDKLLGIVIKLLVKITISLNSYMICYEHRGGTLLPYSYNTTLISMSKDSKTLFKLILKISAELIVIALLVWLIFKIVM
ncbi:hypothetical protein A0J52_02400 [Clostridium sporogenes]|nr:hypothetical protein A0J52_02400 [Clostridium sporogenes]